MKNTKELKAIKKNLAIIKNQDEIIRRALEIYKKTYPEYSADALALMIADETGKSRATIWNKKGTGQTTKNPIII